MDDERPAGEVELPDLWMRDAEMTEFLEHPKFAAIASLRKTGTPLCVPVGFIWDGTGLMFSTACGRGLERRLRRDPRACATIYNHSYPVAYVLMEGDALAVADPDYEISLRIMRRYMTPGSPTQTMDDLDVESFARNYISNGRTLFRLEPTRLVSYDSSKRGGAREVERLAAYGASEKLRKG